MPISHIALWYLLQFLPSSPRVPALAILEGCLVSSSQIKPPCDFESNLFITVTENKWAHRTYNEETTFYLSPETLLSDCWFHKILIVKDFSILLHLFNLLLSPSQSLAVKMEFSLAPNWMKAWAHCNLGKLLSDTLGKRREPKYIIYHMTALI